MHDMWKRPPEYDSRLSDSGGRFLCIYCCIGSPVSVKLLFHKPVEVANGSEANQARHKGVAFNNRLYLLVAANRRPLRLAWLGRRGTGHTVLCCRLLARI